MRTGEGGGEAEGGDQHQGDEDHGDHLALPENREHGEKRHYLWDLSRERDDLCCALQKSSEIDRRTDKLMGRGRLRNEQ